jgi:hypothetical protein
MKPQRRISRWLAILIPFAILFQFMLALPSVSAQVADTPTPTSSPASTPTATPVPSGNYIEFVANTGGEAGGGTSRTFTYNLIPGIDTPALDLYYESTGSGSCDWGNGTLTVGCPVFRSDIAVKNVSGGPITLHWLITTLTGDHYSSRIGFEGNWGEWVDSYDNYLIPIGEGGY